MKIVQISDTYLTASEAIDLIGQYRDAGIELLIVVDRNDEEGRELFAPTLFLISPEGGLLLAANIVPTTANSVSHG